MRTVVYNALSTYQPLLDIVKLDQDEQINIHEASSIIEVPPRPFVAVRMHTNFPLGRGVGRREYAQVWAHDDPGDYETIDEILRLCRIAVEAAPSVDNFLEARWIETGVDLKDDTMGTIMRYSRFQLTGTLRERDQE